MSGDAFQSFPSPGLSKSKSSLSGPEYAPDTADAVPPDTLTVIGSAPTGYVPPSCRLHVTASLPSEPVILSIDNSIPWVDGLFCPILRANSTRGSPDKGLSIALLKFTATLPCTIRLSSTVEGAGRSPTAPKHISSMAAMDGGTSCTALTMSSAIQNPRLSKKVTSF